MELGAFSVSLAVKDIEASRSFYEKLAIAAPDRSGTRLGSPFSPEAVERAVAELQQERKAPSRRDLRAVRGRPGPGAPSTPIHSVAQQLVWAYDATVGPTHNHPPWPAWTDLNKRVGAT